VRLKDRYLRADRFTIEDIQRPQGEDGILACVRCQRVALERQDAQVFESTQVVEVSERCEAIVRKLDGPEAPVVPLHFRYASNSVAADI